MRDWLNHNLGVIKVMLLLTLLRICFTSFTLALIPFGAPVAILGALVIIGFVFEILIIIGVLTLFGAIGQETFRRIVWRFFFGSARNG